MSNDAAEAGTPRERPLTDDAIQHLHVALLASLGAERGAEAFSEAVWWASEHPERVSRLANPLGYLYRVGMNHTRQLQKAPVLFPQVPVTDRWFEPGLPAALAKLTLPQRLAVVLFHGYGLTYREIAEMRGWRISTAQKHTERGLRKLRTELGVSDE